MKKHKWSFFIIFSFLLLLSLLVGYVYLSEEKPVKMVNVSMLVYGNDSGRWTSLKQGLEQAEKDYKVVFNYVATSTENSPKEQIAQIYREIENGAQGLMIAASDSTKLEDTIAKLAKNVPIVMIETSVNHLDSIDYLSADNYQMGTTLAETVMKEQDPTNKVAIISENLQRDSVMKRKQGFVDTLKGYDITYLTASADGMNQSRLRDLLLIQRPDTVVAFDNNTLEVLASVIDEANLPITVYGIGNSDKVVYYLDKELIHAIVYQNGFSTGYLGAQMIYHKIVEKPKDLETEVTFSVIDKETMYSIENQRLLFPLVQ